MTMPLFRMTPIYVSQDSDDNRYGFAEIFTSSELARTYCERMVNEPLEWRNECGDYFWTATCGKMRFHIIDVSGRVNPPLS